VRTALMVSTLLVLLGCEDQNRVAEKRRAEGARIEREAKLKAEYENERELMKYPALATAELQKRISDWLTVSDGVATIVEGSNSYPRVHTMSARSSWLVSCSSGGIEIAISNQASENVLVKQLTRAPLSKEECRLLAEAVGKHMLRLLRASDG
jgi:hypothetical protein